MCERSQTPRDKRLDLRRDWESKNCLLKSGSLWLHFCCSHMLSNWLSKVQKYLKWIWRTFLCFFTCLKSKSRLQAQRETKAAGFSYTEAVIHTCVARDSMETCCNGRSFISATLLVRRAKRKSERETEKEKKEKKTQSQALFQLYKPHLSRFQTDRDRLVRCGLTNWHNSFHLWH